MRRRSSHGICRHPVAGFTLIELIMVLVILGVVSAIGSNFVVSAFNSYDRMQKTSKLTLKGRLAIEQMVRQLRNAVPNSIRLSSTGNCVEFMPIVAAGNYIGMLADADNGGAAIASMDIAPVTIVNGSAAHIVVGGLTATDIYAAGSPAARTAVDTASLGSNPITALGFTGAHIFNRNSVNKRFFIAANPLRFCIINTDLVEYSNYGLLTVAVGSTAPSGAIASLLAQNVSAVAAAFVLSNATQDRNAVLNMSLRFAQQDVNVLLTQEVLIRNVP